MKNRRNLSLDVISREDSLDSATARVFELLAEHGDALTQVREVDHFAYFPTPAARADFIDKSLAVGFKLRATSEPNEVSERFGAILLQVDTANEGVFEKVITVLSDLARQCGGEYDGWETQILP